MNGSNKKSMILPYYKHNLEYRTGYKISKRKLSYTSSLDNYYNILKKSNVGDDYFYSESLNKIIRGSVKMKK